MLIFHFSIMRLSCKPAQTGGGVRAKCDTAFFFIFKNDEHSLHPPQNTQTPFIYTWPWVTTTLRSSHESADKSGIPHWLATCECCLLVLKWESGIVSFSQPVLRNYYCSNKDVIWQAPPSFLQLLLFNCFKVAGDPHFNPKPCRGWRTPCLLLMPSW